MYTFIISIFPLPSLVFFHVATWSLSMTTLMANNTPSCRVPALGQSSTPVDGRAETKTDLESDVPAELLNQST